MSHAAADTIVARTRPPAKLNLFLELLARRDDGFHDIDTVMVPIDWRDELSLQRSSDTDIQLRVQWLPSREVIAQRLGIETDGPQAAALLDIPADESNLVHRALSRFRDTFNIAGGFRCQLDKRIPAGAGMGGASSDAASALQCAAKLNGIPLGAPELYDIAAEIGSDVPFFLGATPSNPHETVTPEPMDAARATGRGERLEAFRLAAPLHFVVVFPGISLSTAKVYANSHVPPSPQTASGLIAALEGGEPSDFGATMTNRLADPAKKLAPQIGEILESLWQADLRTCQLTGSGSACFAIASSPTEAQRCVNKLRAMHEPGAIVMSTQSTQVPARIDVT
ncbi:MAG: 4-(cytidine 5'-diphospho)-2-C-methyl-D-erythritol kinase [Rubripirellula sp.]